MLITKIANWNDEKLSVDEYKKKKKTLNATKNRIENSKIIFFDKTTPLLTALILTIGSVAIKN